MGGEEYWDNKPAEDFWNTEAEALNAELKSLPVTHSQDPDAPASIEQEAPPRAAPAPVPQPAVAESMYGGVLAQSSELSKLTEQIRQRAHTRTRKLEPLIKKYTEIPTVEELQRKHPYWTGNDKANYYRQELMALQMELLQDFSEFTIIVSQTVHADILQNGAVQRR
jgi:hypothetical protein